MEFQGGNEVSIGGGKVRRAEEVDVVQGQDVLQGS